MRLMKLGQLWENGPIQLVIKNNNESIREGTFHRPQKRGQLKTDELFKRYII